MLTIPAKKALGFCVYTMKPRQGTFGLTANNKAMLLVKIT